MAAQNCWEFKKCGREAGGSKVSELGVCIAYPDHGKDCWIAAGTFCGGKAQGSFAQKFASCKVCEFYKLVNFADVITSILAEDLGPAAQSFLAKQCKAMNKDPASLTQGDVEELAKLCFGGISQILGDEIAQKIKQNILVLKG